MSRNQIISIALLVIGIVLIVFGINEYHSTSSHVSRFFENGPSDRSLFFLIGGVVVSVVGILGLVRK